MIRRCQSSDLAAVIDILNQDQNSKASSDFMRDNHTAMNRAESSIQLVEDIGGKIVAYGALHLCRNKGNTRTLYVHVHVRQHYRRKGYGANMEEALLSYTENLQFTTSQVSVKATDEASAKWAYKRGYRIREHVLESVLEVKEYDARAMRDVLRRAHKSGIYVRSMESFGGGREKWLRLYETLAGTYTDLPHQDDVLPPTYEAWYDDTAVPTVLRAGVFVALIGDEWVGATILQRWNHFELYNRYTATNRDFRGLGVASLLKHVAVQHAKHTNVARIRTNNSSENRAMLKINRRMGYKDEDGFYVMERP